MRLAEVREDRERWAGTSPSTFMIHVHGPWGAGKTSVLNFLRAELKGEDSDREKETAASRSDARQSRTGENPAALGWIVVEFNAWQHTRIRPPWWALIRTIYRVALEQLDKSGRRQLRWRWLAARLKLDALPILVGAALLGIVLLLLFVGTEDVSGWLKVVTGALALSGILMAASRTLLFGSTQAAKRWMELRADPLRPLVKLFEELIETIGQPVVVFIDDLDRCPGSYVVELLEGIQTLFRSEPVMYVVAADRKWICSSFEKAYEDFDGVVGDLGRPLGYLFLDKFFQISVPVPRLSSERRTRFWKSLLATEGQRPRTGPEERRKVEREAEETVQDVVTQEELEARIQEAAKDGPVREEATRAAAARQITGRRAAREQEHRLQPFARLLEGNPRSMKRLVNTYGLHQAALFLEGHSVSPEQLARWTILELRWPVLADLLSDRPELVNLLEDGAAPEYGVTSSEPDPALKIPGVSPELIDLLRSEDVRSVLVGELAEAPPLDAKTIRTLRRA